ncbi:Bug family tripartite tricarboxylate transporter substrate binding protein [Siccirubricoccus deserti]
MVPFVPGGLPDSNARFMAQRLAERLGQPVVIENRPGAGGNIGAEAVARARPDGYTLLFGTMGTHGSNPALYRNLPYDALKDFTPIHALFADNNIAVVGASSPFRNLADVAAFARANPGKLNFGSGGVGTGVHLAGALFQKVSGIDIVHVPYRGTPAALSDVVAGRLDLMFDYAVTSGPLIKDGRLRPLAVTGKQRLSLLPETPTVAEAGFAEAELDVWSGLFLPAGVPPAISATLATVTAEVLAQPETIRWAERTDSGRMLGVSEERFRRFIESELLRWRDIVEFAGARLD